MNDKKFGTEFQTQPVRQCASLGNRSRSIKSAVMSRIFMQINIFLKQHEHGNYSKSSKIPSTYKRTHLANVICPGHHGGTAEWTEGHIYPHQ